MNIDDIPLTRRVRNALTNEQVRTIEELVAKSGAELLRIPNFGLESLREIEDMLAKMGKRLSGPLSINVVPSRPSRIGRLEVIVTALIDRVAALEVELGKQSLAGTSSEHDNITINGHISA